MVTTANRNNGDDEEEEDAVAHADGNASVEGVSCWACTVLFAFGLGGAWHVGFSCGQPCTVLAAFGLGGAWHVGFSCGQPYLVAPPVLLRQKAKWFWNDDQRVTGRFHAERRD